MKGIDSIPELVLAKIEEYALARYGANNVEELKIAIADEQFNKIINGYLDDVKIRILRKKADDAKNYNPTEEELIEKFQDKINSAILSDIEI